MTKLTFYFQPPFSRWMPTSIFHELFNYYHNIYPNYIVSNDSIQYNSNCGHRTGPHHLIIENQETGYYKLVTYWDKAHEVLNDYFDWNNDKCLGVYSSVSAKSYSKITATSYCSYNQHIEELIHANDISFENKQDNSLCFRGFLYTNRLSTKEILDKFPNNSINIYSEILSYEKYVKEINNHKIGLSFNGAAEICNRDIEILGVGSVLLRPELVSTSFHDPLIPNTHYIPFDLVSDAHIQTEIIMTKLNELLQNYEYMRYVATNGNDWYNRNGSKDANVKVISQLLNIEELLY
jgi:hypothetical protein